MRRRAPSASSAAISSASSVGNATGSSAMRLHSRHCGVTSLPLGPSRPGRRDVLIAPDLRSPVVTRHEAGPRRSQSVDTQLRRTRAVAVVALLALAVGIVSDAKDGDFWARHALLAGLVASAITVM